MKINKLAFFAILTILGICTFAKAQNFGEVDRVDHSADAIVPLENPANLAWGDADGKTLYFTAVTGLYRLRVNVAGIRP